MYEMSKLKSSKLTQIGIGEGKLMTEFWLILQHTGYFPEESVLPLELII